MSFRRVCCLVYVGCLLGVAAASAGEVEPREKLAELLKSPLKLTSGEDSMAKRFRCAMVMRMPGTPMILFVERFDADLTMVFAHPDGTPIVIIQNNEAAAFELESTPKWSFFNGARTGVKVDATLESLSWKTSQLKDSEAAVPQFEIDVGSILRWVQNASEAVSRGKYDSEIFIKTETGIVTLQLANPADGAFPLNGLFAFGKTYLLQLRFNTNVEKRRWNTMKLSEAAKILKAEVQPLTEAVIERSQGKLVPARPHGDARRRAWQILDVMQVPVVDPEETPREQMLRSGRNARLGTREENVSRFCIDRLVVNHDKSFLAEKKDNVGKKARDTDGPHVSRLRFRIERDGQTAVIVVQTDAGDPVALCRENWVLVLDADRGWLLHSEVETSATYDLLPQSGPGALGLNWKPGKGATVNINYELSKLLGTLLEADWQAGRTDSSLHAFHATIKFWCDLSLSDPTAEFPFTSARFQSPNQKDELKFSIGDEARPLWTGLTREAVIAALHPIEEPLGEQRQVQMQVLQHGLTSAQRAKSKALRDLVEEPGVESEAAPAETPPADFKRLP